MTEEERMKQEAETAFNAFYNEHQFIGDKKVLYATFLAGVLYQIQESKKMLDQLVQVETGASPSERKALADETKSVNTNKVGVMQKRINARLAMQEIVYKRDFNAGNFWGKWFDDEGQGEYQVYSYRQCIGTYYLADEKWILNTQKYSMTTSKHQNYLKRAVNTPDLALV